MSWIEKELDKIEARDQEINRTRDWTLYKANRLVANRLPLWAAIIEQVRSDIDIFNRRFQANSHRQLVLTNIPACTLTVAKSSGSFSVTATISADGSMIPLKTSEIH